MISKLSLKDDDSVLLTSFGTPKIKKLVGFKSDLPREAASLSKIFLALETTERLDKGEVKNHNLEITKKDVAGYGSDILVDLVSTSNKLYLDIKTLVGLMVKYSCNSSAFILANKMLAKRNALQKKATKYWKLRSVKLIKKYGDLDNKFSLEDILKVYEIIFSKSGELWDFLRDKLKTSRNIYYLFDQLEVSVIASKSGTIFKDGYYWVSDTGVIKVGNKKYFVGAIIKRKRISTAVKKIRSIGKRMIGYVLDLKT